MIQVKLRQIQTYKLLSNVYPSEIEVTTNTDIQIAFQCISQRNTPCSSNEIHHLFSLKSITTAILYSMYARANNGKYKGHLSKVLSRKDTSTNGFHWEEQGIKECSRVMNHIIFKNLQVIYLVSFLHMDDIFNCHPDTTAQIEAGLQYLIVSLFV